MSELLVKFSDTAKAILNVFLRWDVSNRTTAVFAHRMFETARSILVLFLSSFFFIRFFSVYVVHLYSSNDTTTAWKNPILSDRSDFHMIDYPSIVVHIFTMRILTSFSVDEILLSKYGNCSTNSEACHLK